MFLLQLKTKAQVYNSEHSFVEESMKLFISMSKKDKAKAIFIHFNHSNPLLQKSSDAQKTVKEQGYNFAYEGMTIDL